MPEAGAVPALVAGLFDDAAIFPPGNAPMPDAVRGHVRHRSSWYASAVGPFVCSAARFEEFVTELKAVDVAVDLALTVPAGIAALPHEIGAVAGSGGRARLRAVEVPLGEFDPAQAGHRLGPSADDLGFAAYLEVPAARLDEGLATAVAAAGCRAKLRTGGTGAGAFPTEAHLAGALAAAVAAGLPFKCTAGLHHAVRHRDPETGFEHHGFLNVVLATCAALDGGGPAAAAAALADQDAAAVAARAAALDPDEVSAVRALFVSLGTCSIDDPVRDLLALGLLAAPR